MNAKTTTKVVGSLAVVGTAAAVAGLGTYGTFTDSTTPVSTTVQTGTVDINLGQPSGSYAIPATTAGFVPGDSVTRAVNLTNDGSSALSSITLTSNVSVPSLLTTDTTNGLQLSIKECSVPYTQGGTATAATYTCPGTERSVFSGPVLQNNVALSGLASLNPGGADSLVFSISLPSTAGNSFQNQTAALTLTFTGVQRSGTAR